MDLKLKSPPIATEPAEDKAPIIIKPEEDKNKYLTCDPVAILRYSGFKYWVSKRRLSAASSVFAELFRDIDDVPKDETKLPEIGITKSSFSDKEFYHMLIELHRAGMPGVTPTIKINFAAYNCIASYNLVCEFGISFELDFSGVKNPEMYEDADMTDEEDAQTIAKFAEILSLAVDREQKSLIKMLLVDSPIRMTMYNLNTYGMIATNYTDPKNVLTFDKCDLGTCRLLLKWVA